MPAVCNSTGPAIEVLDVSKHFKTLRAVDQVRFTIERGEYVALLGPNGAGKTTLVEMIEGLQSPDAGEIRVLGLPWRGHENLLRSRLGIALQETRLIDKLNVMEILNLFGSFYGRGQDDSRRVLGLIGLEDKRRTLVENLSGGQRQRLALGIAIINEPEILILDEPTIGLDPQARREIWVILQRLKARCTTLILTTHYMEEAEALCEKIFIMHQGRFLAEGRLDELLASQGRGEIIEYTAEPLADQHRLGTLPGVIRYAWDPEQQRGRLEVEHIATALPALLALYQQTSRTVRNLECRKRTLDDLFLDLTGRGLDA